MSAAYQFGKRGKKAPPKSKPGNWDKPERPAHATKAGPGRKAQASATKAPRLMAAPDPLRKLPANVGRDPRRVWREGEPMQILQPAREERARIKARSAT